MSLMDGFRILGVACKRQGAFDGDADPTICGTFAARALGLTDRDFRWATRRDLDAWAAAFSTGHPAYY